MDFFNEVKKIIKNFSESITFKNELKNKELNKIIFLGLFFILFGIFFTIHEWKMLKENEIKIYSMREKNIEAYFKFISSTLNNYSIEIQDNLTYKNSIDNLIISPLINGFTLYTNEMFKGRLISLKNPKDWGSSKSEIESVLRIDKELMVLKTHFPEILSVYYLSNDKFLYAITTSNLESLNFTDNIYEKDLWIEAKERIKFGDDRTIITSIHKVDFEKVQVITIMKPVIYNEKFIGVFAIDLSEKTISNYLEKGSSLGLTYLYKGNNDINNLNKENIPKNIILKLKDNDQITIGGMLYLSSVIKENDIVVIHKINLNSLFLKALYNTAYIWIILYLLFIVIIMYMRLKLTINKVTYFMNLDSLSEIYNRRGFFYKIEYLSSLSHINEEYFVILMDIDFFKKVNDVFGHAIGDHIIKSIGNVLNKTIQDNSTVYARWGGEEFIIVKKEENYDKLKTFIKNILFIIHNEVKTPDGIGITISAGISKNYSILELDKAIEIADNELYNAKKSGRKCISFNNNTFHYILDEYSI